MILKDIRNLGKNQGLMVIIPSGLEIFRSQNTKEQRTKELNNKSSVFRC